MENRQDNNFDFLRLMAAIGVIFTHSYALLGLAENDFLSKLTHGVMSFSRLGVWIFFIISGYLITLSALRSRSFKEYWMKRIIRIFPALFVVLAITVFVFGPLLSDLSFFSYFSHPQTWNYFKTLTLYGIRIELPGVFLHNPYPRAVNGSLWTLSYEFTLYCLPAFFFFMKNKIKYIRLSLVFIFFLLVFTRDIWTPIADKISIPILLLNGWHLVNLGIFFLSGVLLALYKGSIHFSSLRGMLVALCFLAVSRFTSWGPIFAYIAIPYIVLCVAYAKFSTSKLSQWGDISYGVYIYAFLIQQTLVQVFFRDLKNPLILSFSTLCLVIPLAYLSWRFVEKPALQWKKKWPIIQ